MNFVQILKQAAEITASTAHDELFAIRRAAGAELKRLLALAPIAENPLTVFERWALPPNRGIHRGFERRENTPYGDHHLNAALLGFMQCYAWLSPQIAHLQVNTTQPKNSSDVLSNDKTSETFSKPVLSRETTEHSDHEDDEQIDPRVMAFIKTLMSNGDSVVINGERFTMTNGELVKSTESAPVSGGFDDMVKAILESLIGQCDCEHSPDESLFTVAFNPKTHCVVPRDVHDAMNEFLKKVGAK